MASGRVIEPVRIAVDRRRAAARRPFAPDAHAREILDQAAKTAYKTSRVIGFEQVVGGISYRIYPDRHWANPFADGTPSDPSGPLNLVWTNTAGGYLVIDARINFFTNYYSISPGMLSIRPGKGANYLIAFTDSEGTPLSGGSNYRLRLPPNIPAAIFWSVTVYDAEGSVRDRASLELLVGWRNPR